MPLPADVDKTGGRAPYLFPLDDTRSSQPWLTLQGCGLLVLGLSWGLYLLTLPWEREDRIRAAEGLVFGISLLALTASLAFLLRFHVPGWDQEENRGWFPNRNQTADVLALCGIVNYALIFDRFRKGKRVAYLLLLALVPIVTLLVISLSRAGILLFFGGLVAFHLWPRGGARRGGASIKWVALSVALGLGLLALFLTWGGQTLQRFEMQGADSADLDRFSRRDPAGRLLVLAAGAVGGHGDWEISSRSSPSPARRPSTPARRFIRKATGSGWRARWGGQR